MNHCSRGRITPTIASMSGRGVNTDPHAFFARVLLKEAFVEIAQAFAFGAVLFQLVGSDTVSS